MNNDNEYGPWIAHNGGPCPVDGETEVEFVWCGTHGLNSAKRRADGFAYWDCTDKIKPIAYRVKKPPVLELGKEYTLKNGEKDVVIYVNETHAWMKPSTYNATAYVWTIEGVSISLNIDYNVDFSK